MAGWTTEERDIVCRVAGFSLWMRVKKCEVCKVSCQQIRRSRKRGGWDMTKLSTRRINATSDYPTAISLILRGLMLHHPPYGSTQRSVILSMGDVIWRHAMRNVCMDQNDVASVIGCKSPVTVSPLPEQAVTMSYIRKHTRALR